jgi:hypothetical protein
MSLLQILDPVDDPEFTELGLKISRLRVSLRMKKRRTPSSASSSSAASAGSASSGDIIRTESVNPAYRVPLGPASNTSTGSESSFRSRLSSHSSVASTDSGFVSRPSSRSRLCSSGSLLQRIASRAAEDNCRSAEAEFSIFYQPTNTPSSRSRSLSMSSSSAAMEDSSMEIYSTIEELTDPFDELPPPLPPRRATFRPPALPPYPSSAVRILHNITNTILC